MPMTKAYGSYFRNDMSGLGAPDDQALPFPDQALIAIVQSQPSLKYTEWASQSGDVSWTEVSSPAVDYQAFAVTDFQIVAVSNTTSAEVVTLAVISPTLSFASAVASAFNGTPYAYSRTEAIYAQADPAEPPRIYFLYWLTLRPATDPNTGPTSLNYAATSILGVLSYVLEIPRAATDRAAPNVPFETAFTLQQSQGSVPIPQTPAVLTTIPATPAVTQPAAPLPAPVILNQNNPLTKPAQASVTAPATTGDTLTALFLVAAGATAAVYAYRYVKKRRAS